MSEIIVSPAPVPGNINQPKKTNLASTPSVKPVNPPAPSPASQPTTPSPPVEEVLAILTLKDGSGLTYKASDLKNLKADLPRDEYLIEKYRAFHLLMEKNKDRLVSHHFKDPSMDTLYQLNRIISIAANRTLPPEMIQILINELEQAINNLPDGMADKSYLLIAFVKQLFDAKLISKERAEAILIKLVKTKPQEIAFHEALCQFYVSVGLYKTAAVHYGRIIAASKIPPEEPRNFEDLESMLKALYRYIRQPADALLLQKLGDYLRIWGMNEPNFQIAKQLLFNASNCYSQVMAADPSDQSRRAHYLKKAMVDLALCQLYSKKSEYTNQDTAIAYFMMAIMNFEAAVPLTTVKHEKYDLLVKLGDLYLTRAEQENEPKKADPFLKTALDYYLKAKNTDPAAGKDLCLKLAAIYAKRDEYDKAIAQIKTGIDAYPDDPILYTTLGDLYYASGKLTVKLSGAGAERQGDYSKLIETLRAYRTAFEKARKINDPQLLSIVYRNFTLLRIKTWTELGAKFSSNPVLMMLRMASDLMNFINPLSVASAAILRAIHPPKIPKHTRDELERFLSDAGKLETEMWLTISNNQSDIRFYINNLNDLTEFARAIDAQLKKANGDIDASGQMLKSLREIKREIAAKIEQHIKAIAYLAGRKRTLTFDKEENIVKYISESFGNYFALLNYLKTDGLPPNILETLKYVPAVIWSGLIKDLKQALEFANKHKSLKLINALLTNLLMAGHFLMNAPIQDEEQIDALKSALLTCFQDKLRISKDRKDIISLLALAREPHLGILAVQSLKGVLKLAKKENNLEALITAGEIAMESYLKLENQSAKLSQLYREIAIEAHQKALKIARAKQEREKEREIAVVLWRLGQHQEGIDAFLQLAAKSTDPQIQVQVYIDLALMHIALARKPLAENYYKKALAVAKAKRLYPLIQTISEELTILRANAAPPDMQIGKNPFFSAQQLRALPLLYARWFGGNIAFALTALREFSDAHGLKTDIGIDPSQSVPTFNLNTKTILKVQIVGVNERTQKKLFTELNFAGLRSGMIFKREKVDEALKNLSNRLQAYDGDIDWKIEEKENGIVITLMVKEQKPRFLKADFTGGNIGTAVGLMGGWMGSGGERLGASVDYKYFFSYGYQAFSVWESKLFYHDPRLFTMGGKPVSLTVLAERTGRLNYTNLMPETLMGGSVKLGLYTSPKSSISIAPSFYYVSGDYTEYFKRGNEYLSRDQSKYFKQGYKIEYRHDERDHFLFPRTGFYLSTWVEPGYYFGGNSGPGKYVAAGASLRKYFALPHEFGIMLGAKGMVGAGLRGGDQFFLGDGIIRNNKKLSNVGTAALGGTAELRLPFITKWEWWMIKPAIFFDYGLVFKSASSLGRGFGVGVAFKMRIAKILPIEISFGFPSIFGWRMLGMGED